MKWRNIVVGVTSMLMLATIPLAASAAEKGEAPVTAYAATGVTDNNNLAKNKWDWALDKIACEEPSFGADGMHIEGFSSGTSPYAMYKTRKLDDFHYTMDATMNLKTAYETEGVDSASTQWDYSTLYLSFMSTSESAVPLYAKPWEGGTGGAYFSFCFEKVYSVVKYCGSCPTTADRRIVNGVCKTCGKGDNIKEQGWLIDAVRVYRNEAFDNRGRDRVTVVEKVWYDGIDEEAGNIDSNFDGLKDDKDFQKSKVGVNFSDGNPHQFDIYVKNNAANNGIIIKFDFDGKEVFSVEQLNSFTTSYTDAVTGTKYENQSRNVNFSGTSGWLGFWTDSSFPLGLPISTTQCYVDIREMGIAPITGGVEGEFYEKAPKPDLPITTKTYSSISTEKGQTVEVKLDDLFTYEGDEGIEYTFKDRDTNAELGEIRNGYWVWTPTTGTRVNVQVDAVVQDGTGNKKATNYLTVRLSGEDITATQLDVPNVTLKENVATWEEVPNASGYKYKIGDNGDEIAISARTYTLKHNEKLFVKAVSSNINYLDSYWSEAVTFTAKTLDTPRVEINANTASWVAVPDAKGYEYRIYTNGVPGEWLPTEITYVTGLTHRQSIEVVAKGDGEKILDSGASAPVVYLAKALDAPVVSFVGNKATWGTINGASGYQYKIGNSGEVLDAPENREVQLTHGQTIYVMALGDNLTSLDSAWSNPATFNAEALEVPYVELNANEVTWEEVDNATRYVYKLNGGAETDAPDTFTFTLNDGDTFVIKAVDDNGKYLDSAWSSPLTFNATVLKTPAVTLNKNVASWAKVSNAEKYEYRINGGTPQETTALSAPKLADGDSIQVRAIGDGVLYINSGWSAAKTFYALTLETPVVTLSGNTASWFVENAASYVYKIGINGEEVSTTETSKTLTHGQTIYVKAIGDNELYLSGNWSKPETYNEGALNRPNVTLDGKKAVWEKVSGATAYVYKINNGTEERTTDLFVELTHGQTVKVKAVGEGKSDSYWSEAVTYEATALSAPVVTLIGNTASWKAVDGATGYVYKIGINGEEIATAETEKTLTHNQTIYVKAVDSNGEKLNSAWSVGKTYVATALTTPVVTLSGNTASWFVENAASYVYKIGINGEEIATAETSKTLTHNQTIYVKAVSTAKK